MKTHLLLPVLLLVLVGCGDDGGSSQATTSSASREILSPCQLLTPADVQGTFGNSVEVMADEPETCVYNSKGNVTDIAPFSMLTITLMPNANAAEAQETMQMSLKMQDFMGGIINDAMKTTNQQSQRTLSGIGDEAYLHVGNLDLLSNTQLIFRKERVVMTLGVVGLKGDSEVSKLENLARVAADKL